MQLNTVKRTSLPLHDNELVIITLINVKCLRLRIIKFIFFIFVSLLNKRSKKCKAFKNEEYSGI